MKKSKFIKSTIILILGGFITKILGMIIKIVTTRLLGPEGIGIYMLLSPTFMLLIALAQLGFPIAISKLVSERKNNNKKIVLSIIPVSLAINIVILITLALASSFISNNMLNEPRTHFALICVGLVLPFISISSIIRGYFFGKEKMLPHVISNITEDVIRLIVLIIGIPIFLKFGIEHAVAFVVLANIISEVTSIVVLIFFLPKKITINKEDFVPKKESIKNILNISIPTTGSRIIGNIGHFFEPVIITSILLGLGYSNKFIVTEYGIIAGYIVPLLFMPAFFTTAISQALIPVVSYAYSNNQINYTKRKIKQGVALSLLVGIPATILFIVFPENIIRLIYNTEIGITYLKVLAPIFLIYYIQSPITSSLQAMGFAKDSMMATLYSTILKLIILIIFTSLNIGLWSLVISIAVGIVFVTTYNLTILSKKLKNLH